MAQTKIRAGQIKDGGAVLTVQDQSGTPTINNVDKIIVYGSTITDLGGGDAYLLFEKIPKDGWYPASALAGAWTRTGNFTFTVSGDITAVFRKGTKVKYKDGGAYEYGAIASSSYSAPDTTVTLITNSDYAMAAATITDTYVSYVENPEDFPQWFNYTTTPSRSGGAYTNDPTINIAKWKAVGQQIFVVVRATMHATPGSSGYQTYSLPLKPAASSVAVGMQVSDIYAMSAIMDLSSTQLRAWKYDGTTEATGSKIYHYSGSYQY